jgi:RNA polymerase sigma factor (TIGR02999 family)
VAVEGVTEISGLVAAWGDGDERALGRLISAVYPELRRIARFHLNQRQGAPTLESAALANEAYLKLMRAGGIRCENRVHFLAVCAQVIRRVLVDHARGRGNAKRGGQAERVPLDNALLGVEGPGIEILALHRALDSLAEISPRQARVVELRYFGGLNFEETAEVLGITPVRAKRDWKIAKTWLYGLLSRDQSARAADCS